MMSQPMMAAMVAIVVLANVGPVSLRRTACRVETVDEDERADVEAVPAHPQQGGAEHGERQVVRAHLVLWPAEALADDEGQDQSRDTSVDVDRGTACVVLGADVVQMSASSVQPKTMWAMGK